LPPTGLEIGVKISEDRARALAGGGVLCKVGGYEQQLRAEAARDEAGHGAAHAELARRVVGRRHHAHPAHRHRHLLQRGVVALLD
jgi:hypothetical protein